MKAGWNRPGRKDHPADGRAIGERRRRHARRAALAAVAVSLALTSGAGAAVTGGAWTAAADRAQAGSGLAFSPFRSAGATWYGPGLYGNTTACGRVLRPRTVGLAHRSLPCGTPVKVAYRGRRLVTRVIDRGPYSPGHDWDLTNGARRTLGFEGSNRIRYAVALRYARR